MAKRGVEGNVLFPTPAARSELVAGLGEIARQFAVELNAYCAMESHYHVLVRAAESELRRAFGWLDRHRSSAMEGVRLRPMAFGRHLLQVTSYIHRNPVEAGLVSRPADWHWSSYKGYVDPLAVPPWLRTSAVLGLLGSIGARQRYRRYVDGERCPGCRSCLADPGAPYSGPEDFGRREMPTAIAKQRTNERCDVPAAAGMKIEFIGAEGFEYSFPILTLNAQGLSFSTPRRVQGIENGAHVGNVSIRLGKVRIRGNLVITHCGRMHGADYGCGAQFCPLGEDDRNELVGLISRVKQLEQACRS